MKIEELIELVLQAAHEYDRDNPLGFAAYDATMRIAAPRLARCLKIAMFWLDFSAEQVEQHDLHGLAMDIRNALAAIEKELANAE